MNYITFNAVPRTPWAEQALTVSTVSVRFDATKAAGSLMIRARLEGGPIRFEYLSVPTSTVGTPLYDSDVVEWSGPEIAAIMASGGLIRASSSSADATLWLTYYR